MRHTSIHRLICQLGQLSIGLFGLTSFAACDSQDQGDQKATGSATGKADSAEDEEIEVLTWSSPGNVFPGSIEYTVDADYNAAHCELFVDRFGDGSFTNGGATNSWLQADVVVPEVEGDVLNVGMFVATDDGPFIVLARETEESWATGFQYYKNTADARDHEVASFAFFVDVERPDGEVARFWQSAEGRNFNVEQTFSLPTTDEPLGGGTLRFANDEAPLFDQKHACEASAGVN